MIFNLYFDVICTPSWPKSTYAEDILSSLVNIPLWRISFHFSFPNTVNHSVHTWIQITRNLLNYNYNGPREPYLCHFAFVISLSSSTSCLSVKGQWLRRDRGNMISPVFSRFLGRFHFSFVARIFFSREEENVVEEHPSMNKCGAGLTLDEEYFLFLRGLLEKFLSNPGVGHENLIPRETTPFISTPRFERATPLFRYHFARSRVFSFSFFPLFFFLFLLWNSLSTISCVALTNAFFRRKERKKRRKEGGNEEGYLKARLRAQLNLRLDRAWLHEKSANYAISNSIAQMFDETR